MRTLRSSSRTGCRCSSGVMRPLRPTRNSTARTSASAWRAGYFQAAAQLGGRACQCCPCGRAAWRSTTPSVAKGRALRNQCSRQCCASPASAMRWLKAGLSAKPRCPSSASRCAGSAGPSGQSQTNRPMPAASSAVSVWRASNPATRARAPWPPRSACTWPGRRQYSSPCSTASSASGSCAGTAGRARTVAVQSWPWRPSPRLMACASRPARYARVTATPSTLGWIHTASRRASQSSTSSSASLSSPVCATGWATGPASPARGCGAGGACCGKQSRQRAKRWRAWS